MADQEIIPDVIDGHDQHDQPTKDVNGKDTPLRDRWAPGTIIYTAIALTDRYAQF